CFLTEDDQVLIDAQATREGSVIVAQQGLDRLGACEDFRTHGRLLSDHFVDLALDVVDIQGGIVDLGPDAGQLADVFLGGIGGVAGDVEAVAHRIQRELDTATRQLDAATDRGQQIAASSESEYSVSRYATGCLFE